MVCKTVIGGSIPPRASILLSLTGTCGREQNLFVRRVASTLIAGLLLIPASGLKVLGAAAFKPAPEPVLERPPIIGVAHIGLKTDNLAGAREFYGHVLGFEEPFTLDKPGGGLMLTYFKVNDHQYVEVFPDLESPTEDRLSHIAFETTDAARLRDYLASRRVTVPAEIKPSRDGNLSFMVKDPDGHSVEFVQYLPGSPHSRN